MKYIEYMISYMSTKDDTCLGNHGKRNLECYVEEVVKLKELWI